MAEQIVPQSTSERMRDDAARVPRWWLLPNARPAGAWIETIVITLIALGAGWLADRNDPLVVNGPFPWVWFAPVLVALRYGVLPGVASAAILIAAWTLWHPGDATPVPKFLFLGGLLLTLVCGEYGAAWRARLRRAEELSAYLEDRVERATKRLFLLRLSHERLEQELLSQPTTLRDALAQLRLRLLATPRGATDPLPWADEFLRFLARHCQLESAALHAADGRSVPGFRQVARLGTVVDLAADDPLLAYVLDTGALAHVQTGEIDRVAATPHLVVAPISTSDGRLLGVLSVGRMPFFALTQDTLQLMGVLLGAYADTVQAGPDLAHAANTLPGAPEDFTEELARLWRVQRDYGIASHMVVFLFGDHANALDAHQLMLRQRRSPDVAWTPRVPNARAALVNLLPISGPAAVDGYLVRTENALVQNFGADFRRLGIRTFVIPLSEADPARALVARLGLAAGGG